MIYLTQLIYVKKGKEAVFHQFEDVAIPIIKNYKGHLMLRIRPDEQAYIEAGVEKPYEVHLISFENEDDFNAFMKDEERKKFLHLKEESIRASVLIMGRKL